MQAYEAQETLDTVKRLQTNVHKALNPTWFVNILWGVLVLIGGPIADLFGSWVALYWMIVGPIGMFFTIRFFRQRENQIGIRKNPLPWIIVSIAMLVGAFAAGAFFLGEPEGVGPMLVVSAGVAVIGLLAHRNAMALIGLLGILAAVAVAIIKPPVPNVMMALVLGGGLLLLGLRERAQVHTETETA